MSFVLGLIVPLAILAGLVALGVRAWRGRSEGDRPPGEVIPYLLLALAVGVAGFSLAELAAAALVPDRLVGDPTTRIASSLAGIVVAAPIALLLWRRQARRRDTAPEVTGWPLYLALIEVVFLTSFFVAVGDAAAGWFGRESARTTVEWTDPVVFAAIVFLHRLAGRRQPPRGNLGALPGVAGSAVSLVAMTTGLVGSLDWLFSLLYSAWADGVTVPDPAVSLGLLLLGAPVWLWTWFREAIGHRDPVTGFYLGAVSTAVLSSAVGAVVAIVALFIGFLVGEATPPASHFRLYPLAFSILLVAAAAFIHHRAHLGAAHPAATVGYRYAMAGIGLATLIGTATALVEETFSPRLAGAGSGQTLITLGASAIAAGTVWWSFWRQVQGEPPVERLEALPRRVYLVGGAVITGLVAAGATIGTLVVLFQALLGDAGSVAERFRVPATLALFSGLALWHLLFHLRTDNAAREEAGVVPFPVVVICSDPGPLEERLPNEARLRVTYRNDDQGVVDGEMADAIVAAVGTAPTLVWVEGTGFRVAPARRN